MTDNITNSIDACLQSVSDLIQSPAADAIVTTNDMNLDTQTYALPESDAAQTPLQQAAVALVQYVQTVIGSSDTPTESDNRNVLHEMATAFMEQTAAAISTNVTAFSAPQASTSDNVISANLNQASSTFVEHLGGILLNPQASDVVPTAVLMQDVQEIWKNKAPADTLVSTASSIWTSIKESEHLPVIAGMLASVLFKKK